MRNCAGGINMENFELEHQLHYITMQVVSEHTQVKQYPYRTAHLNHTLMSFPRSQKLEERLAKKSGRCVDNHTVYEVTLSDGTTFAVFCHDSNMYLGLGVRQERW